MTSTATLAYPGWQHKGTTSAATPTGTLYITPEGNVAVYQGLKAAASGDLATYDNDGVYDITKGSIAFVAGQIVYFDGTDVQTSGLVPVGRCVAAAASGDATVRTRLFRNVPFGRFAAVAASTAVSNTTTETAFDVYPTIPANYLKAGDVLRVRHESIATATNSTDTLTVKLYLGSVQIATTGAVDVANNDIAYIDAQVVIRTSGASGTLVATGKTALGASGTVTAKPFYLASTSIDTTAALAVWCKATWSAASSGDSCRQDVFNIELQKA